MQLRDYTPFGGTCRPTSSSLLTPMHNLEQNKADVHLLLTQDGQILKDRDAAPAKLLFDELKETWAIIWASAVPTIPRFWWAPHGLGEEAGSWMGRVLGLPSSSSNGETLLSKKMFPFRKKKTMSESTVWGNEASEMKCPATGHSAHWCQSKSWSPSARSFASPRAVLLPVSYTYVSIITLQNAQMMFYKRIRKESTQTSIKCRQYYHQYSNETKIPPYPACKCPVLSPPALRTTLSTITQSLPLFLFQERSLLSFSTPFLCQNKGESAANNFYLWFNLLTPFSLPVSVFSILCSLVVFAFKILSLMISQKFISLIKGISGICDGRRGKTLFLSGWEDGVIILGIHSRYPEDGQRANYSLISHRRKSPRNNLGLWAELEASLVDFSTARYLKSPCLHLPEFCLVGRDT